MFSVPIPRTTTYDEHARDDFARAHRQALWRQMMSWMLRRENDLLSFEEALECMEFAGRRDRGLHTIPICQIVGSVGRHDEFDREFFPRSGYSSTLERWVSIAKAYYQGTSLPPVMLYKVGDDYYVEDGNHRISVAHMNGQEYIEAHIIELDLMPDNTCSCPKPCDEGQSR